MITTVTLWIGLTLVAQQKPPAGRGDPDQFPLALHRSMEIDDIDRELQRLHDTVTLKRAQLGASQRLSQRGLVSRSDLERESADLRHHEAREAESLAYRALKSYERDVLGQVVVQDELKSYALLLDWVRKQGAISQVDADYRVYELKQTRALYQRKAVSREEVQNAEIAHDTAVASVALARAREAQVLMELAARTGDKAYDPVQYQKLKGAHLKARVSYYEVSAEGSRRRLEIARERQRIGLIPSSDLTVFEKDYKDALAALETQKKALADYEANPTPTPAKPAADRSKVSGRGVRKRPAFGAQCETVALCVAALVTTA